MDDNTKFRPEIVDERAFIADGAIVLGDVTIGADSSVWFNAVVRGDTEKIQIGDRTNIQDGCVLHADDGMPCILGNDVTVGHNAIVHGAIVEDNVMIGMGSIVMNRARIGSNSIIGVGAVVTEGIEIPPGSVVLGIPGTVVRQTTERDLEYIRHAASHYVQSAKRFAEERI